jgi:cell division protein FtsI/penicillin-binding protein 2
MNKHPHRLGSTGYHHKVVQWNRIIEEAIANGTLDPILKDIDERAIRWILGRAGLSEDSKILHPELVGEVSTKIQEYADKRKKGEFKPRRENDILTAALGNPEHTGRARGISSKSSWREAFPEYAASYRKPEKSKRTLEETIDERVQKAINDVMNKMKKTECISFELKQGHMSPPIVPSSVGSVQEFVSGTKYPVDDIVEDKPCFLHIPINRPGTKTKQAATGLVKPGLVNYKDNLSHHTMLWSKF